MLRYLYLTAVLLIACSPEPKIATPEILKTTGIGTFKTGQIYTNNDYPGARLNIIQQINDTLYQATILPENTPINKSPWYGFSIWSETPRDITLHLRYGGEYEHRFVPKVSTDNVSWQPISADRYQVDDTDGSAYLHLSLTSDRLYISAQENIHTAIIDDWAKRLAQMDDVSYAPVGESTLGAPIHLLSYANPTATGAILIIGRQHPPEVPGATIGLMAFVEEMLGDSPVARQFREQYEIVAFPLLNPDGVERGYWRHNARGVDLNRDWIDFTQVETQLVRDFMMHPDHSDLRDRLRYGLDFHTSHSGPYMLTIDTATTDLPPTVTDLWTAAIQEMRGEELDLRPRDTALPYCYHWMIRDLGIEAVTYEEGDEIARDIVRQRARDYAQTLMSTLLDVYE